MVFWLLGISGAGKTTLGSKLYSDLKNRNIPCYIIDGDEARSFFDHDLGYSTEEREHNMKRIIFAARSLSECGILTIVCNISPWVKMRNLVRQKVPSYKEVYLHRSIDNCIENDVKGIYKDNLDKGSIVGVDIKFEEPTSPDLILDTDKDTVEKSYSKLKNFISENYSINF